MRVGARVQILTLRGEPFADLPRAEGFKEVGSRAQAGPAILLYRALARYGPERALAVVGRAVEEGAIAFLSKSIGRLDRTELEALDAEGRRMFAQDRAAKFPNAEVEWKEISATQVSFVVTACRLVQLGHHAGHPELAPLFCSGDARFFGEVERDAELIRPTTIAGGDDHCSFTIRYRETP